MIATSILFPSYYQYDIQGPRAPGSYVMLLPPVAPDPLRVGWKLPSPSLPALGLALDHFGACSVPSRGSAAPEELRASEGDTGNHDS